MQPGAVQIAQPLNDTQLVALIAGHQTGTAEERVASAVDIVVESILQAKTVSEKVLAKSPEFLAEQQAKARANQSGLMVPGGPIHPELLKRVPQRQ